jgi:2-phosphoglycerate kinase
VVDKNKMEIIGIYGVSATGKSTIGNLLLTERLESDSIVTDNLLAIKRMLNPNSVIWQRSSYNQWERIGQPTDENIWKGFKEYRTGMEDYLSCILDRAKTQRVSMIIEGIHIDPKLFMCFKDSLNIHLFLLRIEDPIVHKKRIEEKCNYRPSLMTRLDKYFPYLRKLQTLLLEEAKYTEVNIIETGKPINEAIKQIKDMLRK